MILTLTLSPVLDKSASINKLLPEHKLRCSQTLVHPGGGGINVSRGVYELGGKTCALFPYGGNAGAELLAQLQKLGVPYRGTSSAEATRESFNIFDHGSGEQYRFVQPAEAAGRGVLEQLLLWNDFQDARFLVISGSIPEGLPVNYLGRVVQQANRCGMQVVADSSGKGLEELLAAGVYLAKPSLGELAALSGRTDLTPAQAPAAAQELLQKYPVEALVVSLGASGALLVFKHGMHEIAAPPVRKCSTAGAGDSLVAGTVWALSEGVDLANAVAFGVACGSAAIEGKGTSLFTRSAAWGCYKKMKESTQSEVHWRR